MSRNFGMRIITPADPQRVALGDVGGFDPGPLAELDRGMCTWWHRWLWRALALLAVAVAIVLALRVSGHARDRAFVWPYQDAAGQTQIRCFLPGAGA